MPSLIFLLFLFALLSMLLVISQRQQDLSNRKNQPQKSINHMYIASVLYTVFLEYFFRISVLREICPELYLSIF